MKISDVCKRVENGMDFLDEFYEREDWVMDINLRDLDLNNVSKCVLGQLWGGEIDGFSTARSELEMTTVETEDCGFYVDAFYPLPEYWDQSWPRDTDIGYAVLTAVWREFLKQRLMKLWSKNVIRLSEVEERTGEIDAHFDAMANV